MTENLGTAHPPSARHLPHFGPHHAAVPVGEYYGGSDLGRIRLWRGRHDMGYIYADADPTSPTPKAGASAGFKIQPRLGGRSGAGGEWSHPEAASRGM